MPMHPFSGPPVMGVEIVYIAIILLFCLLVYFKTREIYNLTKHKGIYFFRYAFLFFGLAYATRLLLHLLIFNANTFFDFILRRREILPVSNLVVAYFSTMAILYLVYSTIWKRIKSENFLIFSNIIALIVSVIAFISRSPMMVSLIQFAMLVITLIISAKKHEKVRKKSRIKALYILISVFWLLNLFVLGPRRFLPREITWVFQAISIIVFIAIYYKVARWIK